MSCRPIILDDGIRTVLEQARFVGSFDERPHPVVTRSALAMAQSMEDAAQYREWRRAHPEAA